MCSMLVSSVVGIFRSCGRRWSMLGCWWILAALAHDGGVHVSSAVLICHKKYLGSIFVVCSCCDGWFGVLGSSSS